MQDFPSQCVHSTSDLTRREALAALFPQHSAVAVGDSLSLPGVYDIANSVTLPDRPTPTLLEGTLLERSCDVSAIIFYGHPSIP